MNVQRERNQTLREQIVWTVSLSGKHTTARTDSPASHVNLALHLMSYVFFAQNVDHRKLDETECAMSVAPVKNQILIAQPVSRAPMDLPELTEAARVVEPDLGPSKPERRVSSALLALLVLMAHVFSVQMDTHQTVTAQLVKFVRQLIVVLLEYALYARVARGPLPMEATANLVKLDLLERMADVYNVNLG